MQYKVVPGPTAVQGDAAKAFEEIINRHAVDGWKYHSMETVVQVSKGGCLKRPVESHIYMLIFVKE